MPKNLYINRRISIVAHPGQRVVILMGEDQTIIAMTPETAHAVAKQLDSMANLAESPAGEEPSEDISEAIPYLPKEQADYS